VQQHLTALAAFLLLAGCAAQPVTREADMGTLWVKTAAEYASLGLQAYGAAGEDLDRLLADKSWSALPDQTDAASLPPAIIFDIDETLLDNVQFQLEHEPPFTDEKFDAWHATNTVPAVPGAREFVQRARTAGVELFFVTNRRCAAMAEFPGACPQERITLQDLQDAGIHADAEHLMLAAEKPEWTQEKKVRRDAIAAERRVIMLVGDDLGDFLPCVRKRVYAPCTEPATQESRNAAVEKHAKYWGNGWYILPNPMYGSWTAVQ
jgi:acid phosphatase